MPYINGRKVPYNERGKAMARAAKKRGQKVSYTESTYESILKLMFEAKKRISREDVEKHLQKGIANIAGGKLGDPKLIQQGIAKPSWGAGLDTGEKPKKPKKPKKK